MNTVEPNIVRSLQKCQLSSCILSFYSLFTSTTRFQRRNHLSISLSICAFVSSRVRRFRSLFFFFISIYLRSPFLSSSRTSHKISHVQHDQLTKTACCCCCALSRQFDVIFFHSISSSVVSKCTMVVVVVFSSLRKLVLCHL